jgi:fatty acid desaturase
MQGIARTALFRESQGALPTTLVLLGCSAGWLGSFALMASSHLSLNALGVLLCTHSMVLAAYMIHEAAHQSVFAGARANERVGEWLGFIAGISYVSFERIRHMHMRHHVERVDVACFDFARLLRNRAWLRRIIQFGEWMYLPATEVLMHLQILWRPVLERGQRPYLRRVVGMLLVRGGLYAALALWSLKAALLYLLAYALLLHVLSFLDAFHHTFDQYFVAADEALSSPRPDRGYEMANTYSNLLSVRWPWINVLILNFCYHNAHHERASAPWYRLPVVHRAIYGERHAAVRPVRELLTTWHRNRVRSGVHGVSFLTVV